MKIVNLDDTFIVYSLSKFIRNKYYCTIFYICLREGYVTSGDLRKIFGFNARDYLTRLQTDNIITTGITEEKCVKDDLSHIPGMGKQSNDVTLFRLKYDAIKLLEHHSNYTTLLKNMDVESVKEYIRTKKSIIENNKSINVKKTETQNMGRIISMKNQGIELRGDDLEIYREWRRNVDGIQD